MLLIASLSSATVLAQVPELGDIDLVREQHTTTIASELQRVDRALAVEVDIRERSRLLLVRARLLRLRGEYADAEALIRQIDPPSDAVRLRAWLWLEGGLLRVSRHGWYELGPSADPMMMEEVFLDYLAVGDGLVSLEAELLRATQDPGAARDDPLVLEPERVPAHRAALDDLEYIEQIDHLGKILGKSDLDLLRGNMPILGAMVSVTKLGDTDAILSPQQRASLLRAKPHLDGRVLPTSLCADATAPHEISQCVEWLLFHGRSVSLGLSRFDVFDLSGGLETIEELVVTDDVEARALALLADARARFSAERDLAPLAWAEGLRASNELRAIAVGQRDDLDTARTMLASARRAASASGDLLLELELRAHAALVEGLNHDREAARAELSPVLRHLEVHGDIVLSTQLASLASAMARAALLRADMVGAEILFELAVELRAAVGSWTTAAMTRSELANASWHGGAAAWARTLFDATEADLDRVRDVDQLSEFEILGVLTSLAGLLEFHAARLDPEALRPVVVRLRRLSAQLTMGTTDEEQLAWAGIRALAEVLVLIQREANTLNKTMRKYAEQRASQLARPRTIAELDARMELVERTSAELERTLRSMFAGQRRWVRLWVASAALDLTVKAEIGLAFTEEIYAIMRDPDRPPAALADRLAPWRDSLARHRPNLLAELMVADGRRDAAIEMLRQPPAWSDPRLTAAVELLAGQSFLGSGTVGTVADGQGPGQLPSLKHQRFRALVDLGAHDAAAEVLVEDHHHDRGGSEGIEPRAWATQTARIRMLLASESAEAAARASASIIEELAAVDTMGDPRLRRGSLLGWSFVPAIAAAVDVELARGRLGRAAKLILRAQPSGAAYIARGGDSELANLLTTHDVLAAQLDEPGCSRACATELTARIDQLRREFEARVSPHVTDPSRAPALEDLTLPRGVAVLTHLISANSVHLLLLRGGEPPLIVRRDIDLIRVRGRVQRLGSELGRKLARGHIDADLDHLGALLLPAGDALVGVDTLIVIPHDIIADVPFALLPWTRRERSGRLIDEFELVEAQSLEYLAEPRARAPRSCGSRATVMVASDSTLVHASHEAAQIHRLLGGDLVEDATPEQFEEALVDAGSRLLHVVAHGRRADLHRPAALQLSGASGDYSADAVLAIDGKLATDAVIFSTCEVGSARGSLEDDGFRIGPALLRRGVREVIVPLWMISDSRETIEFWKLFYRAYRRERTLAGALARAQRRARRKGLHPGIWAGYKVISRGPTSSCTKLRRAATPASR